MKNTLKLFPLTVTLLLCISTAAGLKCFTCSGSDCDRVLSPVKLCADTETMCITRTVNEMNTQTRSMTTKIEKSCAAPATCPKGGSEVHPEATKTGMKLTNTTCCSDEDFCNGDGSSFELVWCSACTESPEKPCTKVPSFAVLRPMMCLIAKVKENPEGPIIKVVKGVAGPPLCSKPGDFTYIYGQNTIDVKCCNSDSCNSGPLDLGVEVEVPHSVQSCEPPNYCPLGLLTQLQGLSLGHTVIPPHGNDNV